MAGLGIALALGVAYMTGPIPGVLSSSITNTAATNLYVNNVSPLGNDGNACTSAAAPCLTCQGALNKLPKSLAYPASVTIATGTYAGCNVEGFNTLSLSDTTSGLKGSLVVSGTQTTVTPASGSATGTLSSFTAATATAFAFGTVTAAGWTVNDFQGKFFVVTAGTGLGKVYAISSNTATTIELPGATSLGGATTFAIQSPGTILSTAVSPSVAVVSISGGSGGANLSGTGMIANSQAFVADVVFSNLKFTGTAVDVSIRSSLVSEFVNCLFSGGTTQIADVNFVANFAPLTHGAPTISVINSVFSAPSTRALLFANPATSAFVFGNVFIGGGVMLEAGTTTSQGSATVAAGSNTTMQSNFGSVTAGVVIHKGNVTSIRDRIVSTSGTNNCWNVGDFDVPASFVSQDSSCISTGAAGIAAGSGAMVKLGAMTGATSATYGITASYGATVEITSGTSVTGTTGDTLIDGTAYSYAAIRAVVPKSVHTNTFGTTVYER